MTDNPHIRRAYATAAGRDPDQTVFLQALETLYESLAPLLEEQPHLSAAGLPERLGEPEVTAIFPVIWDDRRGRVRQARGHFIQYCTALGPWRGEILFRRGLDISAAKALALASTLEHSLAGLAVGGGLAGADADPRAMDDGECLRFCRAFMEGLYPLLPRDFHPGLWEGLLPRRELAYLTGQYQRLSAWAGRAEGAVFSDERPLSRQQAAGWGLCQFAELALRQQAGVHLEDQAVLVAGQDGAAGWAGERAARMGARVLAVGDGSGTLYADGGLPLATLRAMALQPELPLLLWAIRAPGVEYRPGPGLWETPADAVFLFGGGPRLDSAGARQLLSGRCAGVFEGVPGAATASAARAISGGGALFVPAIAAGAAGSLMTLGRQAEFPSHWEAERHLRAAMEDIFHAVWEQSVRAGAPGDLFRGAYAAAFRPIAAAILQKGL